MKNLSLGSKIAIIQIGAALIICIPFIIFLASYMSSNTQKALDLQLNQMGQILNENFQITAQGIIDDTNANSRILKTIMARNFGAENAQTYSLSDEIVNVGKTKAQNLYYNGVGLANNEKFIDEFATLTQEAATIFSKTKDGDFMRIATSLRDASGNRLVGTPLGKDHPAYAQMTSSNPSTFYGRVQLFGEDYMSLYMPLLDAKKEVVGILFVAYKLKDVYAILQQAIGSIKIGSNGKIQIIDKKYDKFIVGSDKKPSEIPYFASMPSSGVFEFQNAQGHFRAVSTHNEAIDLYIVTEALIEDFTATNTKNLIIIVIGIVALMVIINAVSLFNIRISVIKRLDNVNHTVAKFFSFINHTEKQIPPFLPIKANDEIGKIAKAMNSSMELVKQGLEKDNVAITQAAATAKAVEEGDLTARITENPNNPQLIELKNVLNKMLDVLQGRVGSDMNEIRRVFDSYKALNFTTQIADAKGNVEVTANVLGEEIQKMLKSSSNYAHDLTQQVNALQESMQQLLEGSNSQASSIQQSASAIEEITGSMQSIADRTQEVTHQAEDIRNVVGVIRDIADQTNLLALNAAI
ncbi:MAG: Cache 3/Cache 2 fusion domain-containing protein, partial [Helicobacter sp.]|nr:Cache 3/Cache 2 fusion domain-containing protein [Helicobacter sp.]